MENAERSGSILMAGATETRKASRMNGQADDAKDGRKIKRDYPPPEPEPAIPAVPEAILCAEVKAEEITDLRKALEALRESEEKYRSLAESSFDAVMLLNRQRNILTSNRAFLKLFGYTAEEVRGKSAQILHTSDESFHAFGRLAYPSLEKMGSFTSQWSFKKKTGEIFQAEAGTWPIPHSTDSDRRYVCVVRDITEQKCAEKAIKSRESLLKSVLDATDNAIVALDEQRRVIFFNEQYVKMWELDPAYLLSGPTIEDIIRLTCRRGIYPIERQEQLVESRMAQFEDAGKHPIDTPRLDGVVLEGYAEKLSQGGYLLAFRDVTQKKLMEEEIQRAEKLEALGVLAGGIAHDFNNILAGIMGNVSLAKLDMEEDDPLFYRLEQAEKSAVRAKTLTQQLLTFSKGGSPVLKASSVAAIIRDAASFALRGSNVKCNYHLPPDLWPVETDEGQIGRAVANIVINAAQAMPQGGAIDIFAENATEVPEITEDRQDGRYVKILIRDHGEGIPRELFKKVFDPFFTTRKGGSGLGLTTAYSIVKKHKGSISLESEPGAGTTFTISLPAAGTDDKVQRKTGKAPFRKGSSVLLMDDDPMVREVAGRMLERIGFVVDEASDGEEAVLLYRNAMKEGRPFAAVIMDLTVPGGMGGKEAIKHLRKLDPDVVALASSGYSNDPVMSSPSAFGFNNVVAKPYQMEQLRAVMGEVLSTEQ